MTEKAKILEYLGRVTQELPIIFYCLDLDHKYLAVNEYLLKVLGTTSYEKDFVGKTPHDFFPKEVADKILKSHKKVKKTGKTITGEEFFINAKSGEIRYFDAIITTLYGDDEKIIGTVNTAVDITAEKKETEQVNKVKALWEDNADLWYESSAKGFDVWRDYLNTPAFLSMLPDIKDLNGLDVAFGDGYNSRLIAKHCKSLVAIDISERFLANVQQQQNPDNISYKKVDATNMPFADSRFDFVVSTMAFMDMPKIDKVFKEIFRVLKPNGFLQFSIIHPCFNTCKGQWTKDDCGNAIGFVMKDYFVEIEGDIHESKHAFSSPEAQSFKVPRFLMPMYKWFNHLIHAGFTIEKVLEPTTDDKMIKKYPDLARSKIVPHSLIIRVKKPETNKYLKEVIKKLPGNIWWKNKKLVYYGCNDRVLEVLGLNSVDEFVGRTDYELWNAEIAAKLEKADLHVLKTGETITIEEIIVEKDGKRAVMLTNKSPLYDEDGKIVGIVGSSTDITARKQLELLEIKNTKAKLQEYEKFAKIADQVAHDIRSPLSSLAMIIKACEKDLPEALRISLRDAAANIGDIANNLSNRYSPTAEKDERSDKEARQPVLVSLALLQLLTDKKYQYKELPVKFSADFGKDNSFAFIKMEPTAFKRMLSNLVNNAVDAFEGKVGKVSLKLSADKELVKIVIQDNGKGIPPKVLDKIRNNIAVTHGKQDGHGIGLTQVSETLQRNGGEFVIESKVGKGTKITLTFSRIANPEWIAEEICLKQGDTIVILDDDSSIHGAWEIRFKDYADIVKLQHFTFGEDAVKFIRAADKDKIVLLTDFELLKQELNGLHVVEQTKVPRSILVTSHFNNQTVRDLANKFNTEILPKQLASEVPIRLIEENVAAADIANLKQVDVVIIEDNKLLADGLAMAFKVRGKTADVYYSGRKFLENFTQYAKDTKICTDYSLGSLTGVDIAKKLHEAGYTNLYLFSGWDFDKDEIPDYLTVISKSDTDLTKKIIGE